MSLLALIIVRLFSRCDSRSLIDCLHFQGKIQPANSARSRHDYVDGQIVYELHARRAELKRLPERLHDRREFCESNGCRETVWQPQQHQQRPIGTSAARHPSGCHSHRRRTVALAAPSFRQSIRSFEGAPCPVSGGDGYRAASPTRCEPLLHLVAAVSERYPTGAHLNAV
ncbi:hypothetical protein C8Q77DRAFT_1102408 [Trametes polyzona]|nr:hypothetical protein C8Q77DRAFT_1102408 [Trametes polyzona]